MGWGSAPRWALHALLLGKVLALALLLLLLLLKHMLLLPLLHLLLRVHTLRL